MRKIIRSVAGVTLTGYNLGCSRYLLQQVATKEELIYAIKCVNTRAKAQHDAMIKDKHADVFVNPHYMQYIASLDLRRKYKFASSELSGLRKLWRCRYTDSMNSKQMYRSTSPLYLDVPSGKYGKCWMSGSTQYSGRVAKDTFVMFSRHTPSGDVEFVNSINNQLFILPRGSTTAEKIKILSTE
jgi:hypothetical protein